METYKIIHSNGITETGYESYNAALTAVRHDARTVAARWAIHAAGLRCVPVVYWTGSELLPLRRRAPR